jgi:NMD protein affecting ribosome stability and mRNA decay
MRTQRKDTEKFGISDKRGRVKTSSDPYISEEGLKEPALCESCRGVYRNKRWSRDVEAYTELSKSADVHRVTCPACLKIAEGYPEGIVTLYGDYLWEHEEEIRNLLHNEEEKTTAKNPLARIIRITREGEALRIEATEEKLAEHLGRTLHKAHQGDLAISWDSDHDLCRVTWKRDN